MTWTTSRANTTDTLCDALRGLASQSRVSPARASSIRRYKQPTSRIWQSVTAGTCSCIGEGTYGSCINSTTGRHKEISTTRVVCPKPNLLTANLYRRIINDSQALHPDRRGVQALHSSRTRKKMPTDFKSADSWLPELFTSHLSDSMRGDNNWKRDDSSHPRARWDVAAFLPQRFAFPLPNSLSSRSMSGSCLRN